MNHRIVSIVLAAPLVTACASQAQWSTGGAPPEAQWSTEDALRSESVEVLIDEAGAAVEIEYHIDPSQAPSAVRAAMHRLHPGGLISGAEKEVQGDAVFWEITKDIVGREVEALFLEDGTLVSEEVEVEESDVPQAVRDAVAAERGGMVTLWEEIRDGDREVTEYHAKVVEAGKRFKVAVSTAGTVRAVVRELAAEIEVPVTK